MQYLNFSRHESNVTVCPSDRMTTLSIISRDRIHFQRLIVEVLLAIYYIDDIILILLIEIKNPLP